MMEEEKEKVKRKDKVDEEEEGRKSCYIRYSGTSHEQVI